MKEDDALAHGLRRVVVGLYRQMQKQINNDEQLSVAAQNVMYQLTQKETLLPSELCALLNISSQYISQVFTQLEALQYISRKPSVEDGRKTLVSLTRKGRQKVLESRREREAWLSELMASRFSAKEKKVVREAIVLLGDLVGTTDAII
jgi:DNA-binding MarR family transcriptional regulator